RVVRRCLEKQPDNRFQSAKDLAFAIENAGAVSSASLKGRAANPTASDFSFRGLFPWAVAGIAVAFGVAALLWARRDSAVSFTATPMTSSSRKLELPHPPPTKKGTDQGATAMVISPDGTKLVYQNADGLWLRWLDRVTAPLLLVRSENIVGVFWSPS